MTFSNNVFFQGRGITHPEEAKSCSHLRPPSHYCTIIARSRLEFLKICLAFPTFFVLCEHSLRVDLGAYYERTYCMYWLGSVICHVEQSSPPPHGNICFMRSFCEEVSGTRNNMVVIDSEMQNIRADPPAHVLRSLGGEETHFWFLSFGASKCLRSVLNLSIWVRPRLHFSIIIIFVFLMQGFKIAFSCIRWYVCSLWSNRKA